MEVNHNQVVSDLNNERKEILTLKGGGKKQMKCKERNDEKKYEFGDTKKGG